MHASCSHNPFPICRYSKTSKKRTLFSLSLILGTALWTAAAGQANIAGGGDGTGPNVTVTEKEKVIILSNGICSISITKSSPRLDAMDYTYNNNGTVRTSPTLKGPGQYYYGGWSMGGLDMQHMEQHVSNFHYSVAVDPAKNGGNYGDIMFLSETPDLGIFEAHFSMLRGSHGFYSTAVQTHRAQDQAVNLTAWGVVTRVPQNFNWLSADDARNFLIGEPCSKGSGIPNSPHEISVGLNGSRVGQLDDKFIYGQDHADLKAWGWSSVGAKGLNIGRWMMTNMDFSNGGPMKRDVSVYPYSELNNSILTGELGMGSDGSFDKGELWTKTCGPWFMYVNNVPASITDPAEAAKLLYKDALAQAEAEKKAWPYKWFKHDKYPQASGRGTVQGKIRIQDKGNPNASNAGIWVGLQEQPKTIHDTYDFQKWFKPYQYWTQTDADGNFTLSNVLPGNNYTLYAYGPGAAGTFLSQNQTGANPPLECNVSARPFAVKVAPGLTNQLGAVNWTPVRTGPTVFEIGYPNRKADKYRHGEDYSFPDDQPKLGFPTHIWGPQMLFPFDFPEGLTYTVGKSRWSTDWNYILPSLPDNNGAYQPCNANIVFNLTSAPPAGATASVYIGAAGYDGDKRFTKNQISVNINEMNLGNVPEAKGSPTELAPTGYFPAYSDDSSIHCGVHGPFSDERIYFPSNLLRVGKNTLTIHMNGTGLSNFLMVDYLRLELPGYVPPAPSQVNAYPGSNMVQVTWPVAPGATSYDILRASPPTNEYVPVAAGKAGLVCGGDQSYMTYQDTTAKNGTPYCYKIVSKNPVGQSVASPASAAATPVPTLPVSAPLPPKIQVSSSGHHSVVLNWAPSSGANYYRIWRGTLHGNGVGSYYSLRNTLLNDQVVGTNFTDTTPSDGRRYRYFVEAVNTAGISAPSATVDAHPVPPAPVSGPKTLTGEWTTTRPGRGITLKWDPVPGATGYVIYRSTGNGAFKWPDNFVIPLCETTWTDVNKAKKKTEKKGDEHMDPSKDYYYQVTAVNAGGVSPSVTVHIAPDKK